MSNTKEKGGEGGGGPKGNGRSDWKVFMLH